jgi:DNA polymerase-3 subunit epsilon
LKRLLERVHANTEHYATDGAIMAYAALIDRALEDRNVDDAEADALVESAFRWGLNREQIRFVHDDYINKLAIAAVADGVVAEPERRDLTRVMRLLGAEKTELNEILDDAAAKVAGATLAAPASGAQERHLYGKSVCFTGELQCRYKGQPLPRDLAEALAADAGLIVMASVTKKLDLLVVADPHTQSGKAIKAKRYGIRVMHEPVFWRAIGVEVG